MPEQQPQLRGLEQVLMCVPYEVVSLCQYSLRALLTCCVLALRLCIGGLAVGVMGCWGVGVQSQCSLQEGQGESMI